MHIEVFGGRGDRSRRARPRRHRCFDLGMGAVVPRETVGDRNEQANEANLYDIDTKYGDVIPVQDALQYLEEVGAEYAR